MKLFVCLHNQLGAISRLRYLSESASHLLSLLVSESIFQLSLPPAFGLYLFIYGGTSLPGRTWVWKAPRGAAAPYAVSAAPRARGPGAGGDELAATADPRRPAGQGVGRAAGGPGRIQLSCLSP